MHRPPWKKSASSFPSDRIKPVVVAKGRGSSSKNKGNANSKDSSGSSSRPDSEAGKSTEVKKLESFIQALRTASGLEKDPKGGCYCLARIHDLSPYNPICRSCGLILCSLNQPYYCCPDCHKPLLLPTTTTTTTTTANSSPTRETILAQLESQLATTISQEIENHQRALDEARKAAGAFPALPGASSDLHHPQPFPNSEKNQTHKVLSLTGNNNNNNNRRTVTVSSYTTRQPSRSGSVTPNVNVEPTRVGPPKPPPITTKRPDPNRPFENFLHGCVTYKT